MKGTNSITLTGTILGEPEMKYSPTGMAIVNFRLGGQYQAGGRTNNFFQRCTIYGHYAEALIDDLKPDISVLVEGRLHFRQWEDGDNKRSTVDVVVDKISVLADSECRSFTTDNRGQSRLVGAINHVTLSGNLTRDPQYKHTPSGDAVCNASVAVSEFYKSSSGENVEKVGFFDITAWRDLADELAQATKGAPVWVEGSFKNDSYTNREGAKVYTNKVEIDTLLRLSSGGSKARRKPQPERQPVAARHSTKPKNMTPLDIDEEFPDESDLPF